MKDNKTEKGLDAVGKGWCLFYIRLTGKAFLIIFLSFFLIFLCPNYTPFPCFILIIFFKCEFSDAEYG